MNSSKPSTYRPLVVANAYRNGSFLTDDLKFPYPTFLPRIWGEEKNGCISLSAALPRFVRFYVSYKFI